MDSILAAIDEGLRRKGLSDAAASKLAVGHPSLIKNFRAVRGGPKRYNLPALQKLADVLDLEFYFGEPRRPILDPGPNGMQEPGAQEPRPPEGYSTVPWHRAYHDPRPVPFAVHTDALRKAGIHLDRLAAVALSYPAGTLAFIDVEAEHVGPTGLWAVRGTSAPTARTVQFEDSRAILHPGAGETEVTLIAQALARYSLLGRIVWLLQPGGPL